MDPTPGHERKSAAAPTGSETDRTASKPPTVCRDCTALADDSNRDSVPIGGPLAPAACPRT